MTTKHNCINCRRALDIGCDVTRVDEGVIGTKGFVPLDGTMFFCSDKCLRDYFDTGNLPSVSGRMP